jgi:hypothetical protein
VLANPFTRRHLWSALIVLAVFLLLNILIAWSVREAYGSPERLIWMVLSVPLGPLTGAVVRGWPLDSTHSDCIDNAVSLLPWHAALLTLAVLAQWVGSPRPSGRIRLTIWILGWSAWYAGGLLSLAHALE